MTITESEDRNACMKLRVRAGHRKLDSRIVSLPSIALHAESSFLCALRISGNGALWLAVDPFTFLEVLREETGR
jgi:hypothetical protein